MFLLTLDYLVVCSLCFLCAGWMIVKVLREKTSATDDDTSDGSGGIPSGYVLPIFDPPGGCHLDDWLVDRMPLSEQEATVPGKELTTASVRPTNYPARQHPVFSDPGYGLSGWYCEQEFSLNG